ncbi:MAG: rRNA maturation RNase YbeY [bacterium]
MKTVDVSGLPRGLGSLEPVVKRAARAVLKDHKLEDYALSITFVGDPEITRLNRTALGKRGATDVIAFDLSEAGSPAGAVGDVYVSLDRARAQSVEYAVGLKEELIRLVVHGVLHTIGYRDRTPAARRRMEARQERAVGRVFGKARRRGGRGRV